jgi:hypothetical protein
MMNTANAAVDLDASMDIVAPSSVLDVTGHTFTVNITLVNVNAMWGWSCVITWNSTVVNCTGKALGPFNPAGGSLLGFIDNVNGKIPKLAYGTTEEETVTGSGIGAFLTFKTKALGNVNLNVSSANYIDYPDKIVYDLPVNQTTVIIVPEFPTFLIIPLFFVITAAIAIMTKKRWMKKY